jgi:hypothetical protein
MADVGASLLENKEFSDNPTYRASAARFGQFAPSTQHRFLHFASRWANSQRYSEILQALEQTNLLAYVPHIN